MTLEEKSWQELVDGVCEGDEAACYDFWQQYGPLIERVAERHLASGMRRRVGTESIAVSACRTFFRRAKKGDFQFADEEAPWRLLCAIVVTKIREKVRYHQRQKRGIAREAHANDDENCRLDPAASEPTPAAIAEFNDQLEQLIASLPDEEQRVLELRMQQCTQEEISQQLKCSERTVRRMLKRIQIQLTRILEIESSAI